MNLICKDVLASESFRAVTQKACAIIDRINMSSSKLKINLDSLQKIIYGKSLSLLTMISIRWNSAQAAFASLLRIKHALQRFEMDHRNDRGFPVVLSALADTKFWADVKLAEISIRPLARASVLLQKKTATISDAFFIISATHQCYDHVRQEYNVLLEKHIVDEKEQQAFLQVVKNFEIRWQQFEQPLFLLCLTLDPHYRDIAMKVLSNLKKKVENCWILGQAIILNYAYEYALRWGIISSLTGKVELQENMNTYTRNRHSFIPAYNKKGINDRVSKS